MKLETLLTQLNENGISYEIKNYAGSTGQYLLVGQYSIDILKDRIGSIHNQELDMKYYSKDILKVINMSNDEFKQLIREELDKSIEEYNKKVPKRRIRRKV